MSERPLLWRAQDPREVVAHDCVVSIVIVTRDRYVLRAIVKVLPAEPFSVYSVRLLDRPTASPRFVDIEADMSWPDDWVWIDAPTRFA